MVENKANWAEALGCCLASHPRDWSRDHRDAWVWGIINGWDEQSLSELAIRFEWSEAVVDEFRSQRQAFLGASSPTHRREEN